MCRIISKNSSKRRVYLEVGGVHTQGEGVQLAQVQKSDGQVVNFADGLRHSGHDAGSVVLDIVRVGGQLLPVGEVGLGLGVHHQQPGQQERIIQESVGRGGGKIQEWLNSPAQSIGADGISLRGGFGPEGLDHFLVVSAKRHVDSVDAGTSLAWDLYTKQGMGTLGAPPPRSAAKYEITKWHIKRILPPHQDAQIKSRMINRSGSFTHHNHLLLSHFL